jgi:hypothetical protein
MEQHEAAMRSCVAPVSRPARKSDVARGCVVAGLCPAKTGRNPVTTRAFISGSGSALARHYTVNERM